MSNNLVVFAKNRAEMQVAQTSLSTWCESKLVEAKNEFAEMEENLAIAKRSKWRTQGLVTATTRAKKRLEYYEKVKAAVDAGYVIVPDFPIDIFAVRTTREYPVRNYIRADWPGDRTEQSDSPPLGEGENVSRDHLVVTGHDTASRQDSTGHMVRTNEHWSESFKEIEFPVKAVRPAILDETSRALQLKVFDEVGIIGAGNRRQVVRGRGVVAGADPMVIGRVIYRKSTYDQKRINFLITWWLNAADLVV